MLDRQSIISYGVYSEIIEDKLGKAPNQLIPTAANALASAPSAGDVTAKQTEINTALAALTGERETDVRVTITLTTGITRPESGRNPGTSTPAATYSAIDVRLDRPDFRFETTA